MKSFLVISTLFYFASFYIDDPNDGQKMLLEKMLLHINSKNASLDGEAIHVPKTSLINNLYKQQYLFQSNVALKFVLQ